MGLRLLMVTLMTWGQEAGAAEWQRASLATVELEYQVRGAGEPVVFIHGGVFADSYGPLSEESALRRYQIVNYHRVGYAGSSRVAQSAGIADQAAQLKALLAKLGLSRAHLAGHSSGALIAMQLALDAPETVRTLTLLEPALSVSSQPNPGIKLAVGHYRAGKPDDAVDTFMRTVAGPDHRAAIERVYPRAFEQARADASTFFEHELPAVSAFRFDADDAKRLRLPVLVVMGERSDEVSPVWRQRHELMLRWIPHAQSFVLPGATHLLQLQNPHALAERLATFLSENGDRSSR